MKWARAVGVTSLSLIHRHFRLSETVSDKTFQKFCEGALKNLCPPLLSCFLRPWMLLDVMMGDWVIGVMNMDDDDVALLISATET